VAGVLLIVPTDRLDFWTKWNADNGGPVVTSVTWTGQQTQEIDFTLRGRKFQPGSLVLVARYTQSDGWKYLDSLLPHHATANQPTVHFAGIPANEEFAIVENPDQRMSRPMPFVIAAEQPKWESLYEHITLVVPIESRLERFLWLLSLLMLPPALGYTTLFHATPWIFRGFRINRARITSVECHTDFR
jgi:hypothetical protein